MAQNLTANSLALLPAKKQAAFWSGLSTNAAVALKHNWRFWALPHQRIINTPADTTVFNAGRGSGKTWYGANWSLERIRSYPAGAQFALVGETVTDVHSTMIAGPSGILAMCAPWEKPKYFKGAKSGDVVLEFPNGVKCLMFSGRNPEGLRGPQFYGGWFDELAKFRYPNDAWDQYQFGARLGEHPETLVTTTPRPIPLMRELLAEKGAIILTGSTYANKANLSDRFISRMEEKYQGTRLGRQELFAEMLDDNPNALWTGTMIDGSRVRKAPEDMARIIIAVDPNTKANGRDNCGIVAAGKAKSDGRYYVLGDFTMIKPSPEAWAKRAVNSYHGLQANKIVIEDNQGGDMTRLMIRNVDANVPVSQATASKGKHTRAEPVAMLYEQGRVSHVGTYGKMEDEMLNFDGDTNSSPDRLDALVWALSELHGLNGIGPRVRSL